MELLTGLEKRKWFVYPVLLLGCGLFLGQGREKAGELSAYMQAETGKMIQERTYAAYFPVFSFLEENGGRTKDITLLEMLFGDAIPLYAYVEKSPVALTQAEGEERLKRLLEEDDLHRQSQVSEPESDILEAVKKENENVNFEKQEMPEKVETDDFIEADKVLSIDREQLSFETLISEYYAVDSTTYIARDQLNAKKLAEPDMQMQQDNSKPQILIYHTHSQEAFVDSEPGDEGDTIIGAGEKLAGLLRDKYGFNVIHHTGKYDVESRDYAYSNAAPALEQILAENPSIEVIIDLHRDQMPEGTKLLTEIEGRPTARFMFFNGLSRTNKTGEIDYLQNPNLDANLAFSYQMQMAAGEYYPGLTRKVYLKGYRYNMHYRPKTLLIELGAQNNTVEEIMNACDPLAHILWLVLSGEA